MHSIHKRISQSLSTCSNIKNRLETAVMKIRIECGQITPSTWNSNDFVIFEIGYPQLPA